MYTSFRRLFGRTRPTAPISTRLRRCLEVEHLATRILPSSSPITLSGSGQLFIHGSRSDDTVQVKMDDSDATKIEVVRNGTTFTFDQAKVSSIRFDGDRGNDFFEDSTAIHSVANGGPGNDNLIGGTGDDTLKGGDGRDHLVGGGGDDNLHGGSGRDLLEGGTGDDNLHGGAGDDDMRGGLGDDHMQGEAGDDNLHGGLGDDDSDGGSGRDSVSGDGGHDRERHGDNVNGDVRFEAQLTSSGAATGNAEFNATTGEFELHIQGAAAGATLDVVVDGTKVGTITTDSTGTGELEVASASFTVHDQSSIQVGDPSNGGLTGTFLGATESELSARLSSTTSQAQGEAEFNAADQDFKVKIEDAAANTTYDVAIDGTKVGQITTDRRGRGELRLSADLSINDGSTITIGDAANPVLKGQFTKGAGGDD